MKVDSKKASTRFPAAWPWLVDEAIPAFVKIRYSPKENWKNKPFGKEDAAFFFKGIEELSKLFTEERPQKMPSYFQHPKFRSSYLLYFFPLQAAKILAAFALHPQAMQAALKHSQKEGVLRVADLGCGPGTASLAFLLWALEYSISSKSELPPIELEWFDTNPAILEDGRLLVEELSSHFPRLRGKVSLKMHVAPWWKAPSLLSGDTSLLFMAHVLNEGRGSRATQENTALIDLWGAMLAKTNGGGILILEPAERRTSQFLSRLRDQLLETKLIQEKPSSLWGPCLHAGRCPLAEGRDLCHFSIPTRIPGEWFKDFSKKLSSEKLWVKFSYLWIASSSFPAPVPDPLLRRVISDPIAASTVLICEPGRPERFSGRDLWRGDIVKIRHKI